MNRTEFKERYNKELKNNIEAMKEVMFNIIYSELEGDPCFNVYDLEAKQNIIYKTIETYEKKKKANNKILQGDYNFYYYNLYKSYDPIIKKVNTYYKQNNCNIVDFNNSDVFNEVLQDINKKEKQVHNKTLLYTLLHLFTK